MKTIDFINFIRYASVYKKKDLYYYSYQWSKYKKDDPKISGPLDETPLKRHEGREVLYFVNRCAHEVWNGYITKEDFRKLEKLINRVPPEIYKQIEIKQWMKKNHLEFASL